MTDIFALTTRPESSRGPAGHMSSDPGLSEYIRTDPSHYAASDIVIIGCPWDEGIRRSGGRPGAASAPDAIRQRFLELTTFNIKKRLFDIGDIPFNESLESTHANLRLVVESILKDGKRIIAIGGGGDVSYPDGLAMAATFAPDEWIAVNIDSRLDVRRSDRICSGSAFRRLMDEGSLIPNKFYEAGYQSHFTSPADYDHIRAAGVHRISLELLRSRAQADLELKEQIRQKFIGHSSALNTFFSFDMSVVRMADAPGTTSPSPLGLRAGEFIQLVKYAASLANTRIVEFTEMNPDHDIDGRTAMLVAIAMHRFCTNTA